MTKKIIITGGEGFVGSHAVEHFLKNTDWDIVVLDKLNYASSGLDRLRDMECFEANRNRVKIFTPELQEPITVGLAAEIGAVDYIINFASESHVDRSIADPVNFIKNNVNLMLTMLEYARIVNPKKFIQFSTDEVYSEAPIGINYKEGERHNPGNPYSASKSAQEMICRAYSNTYGLPINITNSSNIIGERQHSEKFLPLCIKKTLNGEILKIHSNPDQTKAGSRFYLHARNIAQALQFIIEKTDEKIDKLDASKGCWNIISNDEIDNLTMAQKIAKIIGKELKYELINFHSSRPGHETRYGLDGDKLKKAGFNYPVNFEESLKKTVEWTLKPENKKWLQ
ncbi:MAG: GDP-mannose 4,6-dehydratase [Candidatus Paceibacterota bacterium]|jgi:dTDP-glucose 4,6-dehydratase